jgi:CBS domain-containing protein
MDPKEEIAMRAKDIMSTPAVTVRPDTPVKEVAALLVRRGFNAVPVVDDNEELVGIVTEADLVRLESMPEPQSRAIPMPSARRSGELPQTAGEVMTKRVITLPEVVHVCDVARVMLDEHVKSVPIVAGRRVVGMVVRRDVLRVLARDDGEVRAEIEELLDDEQLMLPRCSVEVRGGVVTLRGSSGTAGWRLAELLARSVPGVIDVNVFEVSP